MHLTRPFVPVPRPQATWLSVVASLTIALLAAGFCADLHWGFELACHWRMQAVVVLGLLGGLLVGCGARRRGLTCLLIALAGGLTLGRVRPDPPLPRAGTPWRLAAVNVLSSNRDHRAAERWLDEDHPDVVVALEVTPAWSRLFARFPHQVVVPREDNFGIGVGSRLPLRQSRVIDLPGAIPALLVELETQSGRSCHLLAIHPVPPLTNALVERRDQQFAHLATVIREISGPLIVAGDFNATPWSPPIQQLRQKTGLTVSQSGCIPRPTWSPVGPHWLGLPIDHVLVSPGLTVIDSRVGPDVGSDHLPVIVDVDFTVAR